MNFIYWVSNLVIDLNTVLKISSLKKHNELFNALIDPMEKCVIHDADNWPCPSFWIDFEAKNGLLSLLKDSYKGENRLKVCQVKE